MAHLSLISAMVYDLDIPLNLWYFKMVQQTLISIPLKLSFGNV